MSKKAPAADCEALADLLAQLRSEVNAVLEATRPDSAKIDKMLTELRAEMEEQERRDAQG